jgi:hypothetical protein
VARSSVICATGQFGAGPWFGWAMGKSPGCHCPGSRPAEVVVVVVDGLEKYHSPRISTLVAAGS